MIKTLFSRKWILTTLLVIAALGVMIRLGFWQLDRLAQRRTFNAHYLAQIKAPALELGPNTLDADLENMEYREVILMGEYDYTYEVAIRNQSWENQPGVRLLTPLMISGTETAVLVDRGWIPLEAYQTGNWGEFQETGRGSVSGIIRLDQQPTFGGRPDPTPQAGESLRAWNFVNLESISRQIPYPLLPVYIQQSPENTDGHLPYPSLPVIEISEGPHLSYAIQWFAFAAILGIGYPIYLRREIEPVE